MFLLLSWGNITLWKEGREEGREGGREELGGSLSSLPGVICKDT